MSKRELWYVIFKWNGPNAYTTEAGGYRKRSDAEYIMRREWAAEFERRRANQKPALIDAYIMSNKS